MNRLLRALLRLLPFDFRADYGGDLEQTFRDQRADAPGAAAAGRAWLQFIGELVRVGPREHLAQLRQDARYALRGLRAQPAFSAVVLATLAIGIGATTTMFSVVHAVLLKPLPYAAPDRLVAFWNRVDNTPRLTLSSPEYLDYAEQTRTMALAGASAGAANIASDGADADRVASVSVTPNLFGVIGVTPALGRGITPEDERGGPPVVVISDGLWRSRFGADPQILSLTLTVAGTRRQIVGVLPPGFLLPIDFGAPGRADIVLPLILDRAAPRDKRGGHYMRAFARLAPGASLASARAEMDGILARLMRQYPSEHDQGGFGIVIEPLRDDLLGPARPILALLLGAVALVLVLTCANVANLMLARGESRRRELAVRAALGASRFRMIRQLLTEASVLAVTGAIAGIGFAMIALRAVIALAAGTSWPRLEDASLNGAVLAFAAGLALATGLAFGLVPALTTARAGRGSGLHDGRGAVGGRGRVRRALVVVQVALAAVLLVGAGLVAKSLARVISAPVGFVPDRVLTLRVAPPATSYAGRAEITSFFSRVLDRVRVLPGVQSAGAGTGLPLAVSSGDWSFDIEGRMAVDGKRPGRSDWYVVTPGYFETLGVRLVSGRFPTAQDDERALPVVVINEATARAAFAGADPIGARIRMTSTTGPEQPWRTVVGIAGDVRQRSRDRVAMPELFFPDTQFLHFVAGGVARSMSIVVRTSGDANAIAPSVRAAIREIDPQVPAAQVQTLEAILTRSVAERGMRVAIFVSFAVLAVGIAALGLYGVVAHGVQQRTREMGLRLALGATHGRVRAMVTREAMTLIVAGLALGLAVAAVAAGALGPLLFEVPPRDLPVFAAIAALMSGVGLAASYLPARRATRVDPVTALRAD